MTTKYISHTPKPWTPPQKTRADRVIERSADIAAWGVFICLALLIAVALV